MSTNYEEIIELEIIFKQALNAQRDIDGYFSDLDLHGKLADALIDVGKKKIHVLKEELYPYLKDIYPPFRVEAIKSLGWDTRLKLPTFKNKAYEIWKTDPEEEVREVALISWAGYYYETKDPEVLQELYDIAKSENFPVETRRSALVCLMDVANTQVDKSEQTRILFDESESHIEFNAIVDWALINQIMKTCIPGWG